MRRTIVYAVGFLIGVMSWQLQARDLNDSKTADDQSAQQQTPPRGALYRVSQQGQPGHVAWLFGTIHVGKPAFYPLEPRVMRAFTESNKLLIEVDMRDTATLLAAVQKYGMYGEGDALDKHISADTLRRLQQALNKQGLSMDAAARMKPTMAANMLALAAYTQAGYEATLGTDMYLMTLATNQGKAVAGLESADYQFSLFDNLNATQQEQYLRETLDELKSGKSKRQMRELLDAWGSADTKKIDALMADMLAEKTVAADFTRHILLAQRNHTMSEKIATLLQTDDKIFVAVGLLHLVGKEGVPALLRARGYTVEKIY